MYLSRVLLSLSIVFGISSAVYANSTVDRLAIAFKENPDIMRKKASNGNTLLHIIACQCLDLESTQWLLERGASPREVNNQNQTPVTMLEQMRESCNNECLEIQNTIIFKLVNDAAYSKSKQYANNLATYRKILAHRSLIAELLTLLRSFSGGRLSRTAHLGAICPN